MMGDLCLILVFLLRCAAPRPAHDTDFRLQTKTACVALQVALKRRVHISFRQPKVAQAEAEAVSEPEAETETEAEA